jgi:leucyl aminopeptidase
MIIPVFKSSPEPKQGVVVLHRGQALQELKSLGLFSEEKNAMLADFIDRQEQQPGDVVSVPLGVGEWLVVAISPAKSRPLYAFRNAGGVAVDEVRKFDVLELTLITENLSPEQIAAVTDGLILGDYNYPKPENEIKERKLNYSQLADKELEVLRHAVVVAEATNEAREIADTPANILTPSAFANKARQLAESHGLECSILDESNMRELGMDALLAVSQGSAEEAKLICLEYKHPEAEKTLAMVGKGLTFDAGGISLKNAAGMMLMKYDKCGGTSVLGAMSAIAKIKPKVNVIAVIPSSENLMGSRAYKPGDVIGSYSGKTIEICNTDAEGRLILADALSYTSQHYKPDAMVNLATLTGAVNVALGRGGSAIAGNDNELCQSIVKAGGEVDELLWQMPIWETHEELLKSDYADLVNVKEGGEAGLAQGYSFLKQFVGETPWAALDIAATSWKYRGGSFIKGEGASGFGVRTLVQWVTNPPLSTIREDP